MKGSLHRTIGGMGPGMLCALAGLAASASLSHAQDRVWNGGSGTWSTSSNWTPADVPDTGGENAVISAAGSYIVSVNGSYSIGALTASNPTGLVNLVNGIRLSPSGGVTNNSTITINDTAGGSGTFMQFLSSQTLSGSGSIVLNANSGNLDTAYLFYNGGGEVLTQAAGHTIRGTGSIYVRIDNAGTLNADTNGRTLRLISQPKTNSNLMTATGGGTLLIENIGISQSGLGRFVANGGTVQFSSASIGSGAVSTLSGATNVTGTSTFDSVTFSGPISVINGSNMRLNNSAPTINNGTITINDGTSGSGTQIQVLGSMALNGAGSIFLNANAGNLDTSIITFNGGGEQLTQASTHTIRGTGRIYVNTVNNGLISADQAGRSLALLNQPKTNNATMQAINGGFLDISVPVNQSGGGTLLANGGTVRTGGATISGGSATAQNGGLIDITGTSDFYGTTFAGPVQLENATALRTNGAGLVNNGTITVNATAGGSSTYIQALSSASITGTGTIVLNANAGNPDTAYLTYNGGGEQLTLGSGQTVRGTGRIYVNTINNGLISADQNGKVFHLLSQPKTNNSLMRAINGAYLDISIPVTQASTASILADGATVRMGGATISGGNVTAQNGGLVDITGTSDLFGVTINGPLNIENATALRTNATGFVNNGTITVNATAGGSNTYIQAIASTTISGVGTIVLNANPANPDTAYLTYNGGGEVLTLGAGQTVRGLGRVFVNTMNNGLISSDVAGRSIQLLSQPKTNNATMQAVNGAYLDINTPVTQVGAARILADGGTVRMANTAISGGTLAAQNGGLIDITGTSDIYDLTLNGPLQIENATALRTNATGFVNNGTITINATAGGSNTYLQALASTSITGTGTIRLNANSANLDTAYLNYNGGGEVLTLGSGQTLTGLGRVYVRTVAQGRVAPGNGFGSIGQIDTRQSLTLTGSSTLDIEIGGTNPSQYDRITGGGNLILQHGTIRISTVNGFTPQIGQTFDIVSGPTVSGEFCGHVFARGFTVAYLGNIIRVTYGGCVADVDGGSGCGIPDGGVTIDDLLFYLSLFEAGDINADVDDGSGTGTVDGGVTIDDLLYYLTRFEGGC